MAKISANAVGDPKPMSVDELELDPENPRLSIEQREKHLSQNDLHAIMEAEFEIDELGESFLENGLFTVEPLLVVEEGDKFLVVEGNRRLAALHLLIEGPAAYNVKSKRFDQLHDAYAALGEKEQKALKKPMVSVVPNRAAVAGYIGFRHVTGIKPWPALEKAGYIAWLVDKGFQVSDIAPLMGSKPLYVARHLHAYLMLMQARNEGVVDTSAVEASFGVFMRALQVDGAYAFLAVAAPTKDNVETKPLKPKSKKRFEEFVLWAFGNKTEAPLFSDSRRLTDFGAILRSKAALDYLRSAPKPNFEEAYHLSGGEQTEAIKSIRAAQFALRDSVASAALMKKNPDFRDSVQKCATYLSQIVAYFPGIQVEA